MGKVLAVYAANLGLIPDAAYGSLSTTKVIPKHRVSSKPQEAGCGPAPSTQCLKDAYHCAYSLQIHLSDMAYLKLYIKSLLLRAKGKIWQLNFFF